MKRLTTKIKGSNNYCEFELKNAKYKNLFELSSNREIENYVNTDLTIAIDKLGQLEDIEELCEKIVSQPIYEKYEDNGQIHKEDYTEYRALYNFEERRIELYGYECINGFELDKYGKTWALTKEELEEERK